MRLRAVIATVVAASALVACGDAAARTAGPRDVPVSIVPAELPGSAGDPPLTLAEYPEGAKRISAAGNRSMVAHGRVWEIRRGSTLVGALQVSTLQSKVDVSDPKQRDKLASLVVSGAVQQIRESGVAVYAARNADKVVFLWFGNQLFEVLQVKGVGINPESMLKSIIEFQRPTGELRIKSKDGR